MPLQEGFKAVHASLSKTWHRSSGSARKLPARSSFGTHSLEIQTCGPTLQDRAGSQLLPEPSRAAPRCLLMYDFKSCKKPQAVSMPEPEDEAVNYLESVPFKKTFFWHPPQNMGFDSSWSDFTFFWCRSTKFSWVRWRYLARSRMICRVFLDTITGIRKLLKQARKEPGELKLFHHTAAFFFSLSFFEKDKILIQMLIKRLVCSVFWGLGNEPCGDCGCCCSGFEARLCLMIFIISRSPVRDLDKHPAPFQLSFTPHSRLPAETGQPLLSHLSTPYATPTII